MRGSDGDDQVLSNMNVWPSYLGSVLIPWWPWCGFDSKFRHSNKCALSNLRCAPASDPSSNAVSLWFRSGLVLRNSNGIIHSVQYVACFVRHDIYKLLRGYVVAVSICLKNRVPETDGNGLMI